MRALIEQRLADGPSHDDPSAPLLANVVGEVSEELRRVLAAANRRAAVLIGLREASGGLHVLLTERAADLAHHAGQVSFPGGRVEATDADPVEAALREAREEVGLDAGAVTVAGRLPPHATGTGFCVTPVVGFIDRPFEPRPDPREVSAVFEVPLDFILEDANVRVAYVSRFGSRFRVYEFEYKGFRVWGATASMLMALVNTIIYK